MAVSTLNNKAGSRPYEDCLYRNECLAYCQANVFPDLTCQIEQNSSLVYNGNNYSKLYRYPALNTEEYRTCKDYIKKNEDFPWTDNNERQ